MQILDAALQKGNRKGIKATLALYHGPFNDGFSLGDCPVFDEWLLLKREQITRQVISALYQLAADHEAGCDYAQAQTAIRHILTLEPWQEAAHRQLIRLLALDDQREAALTQYETCCQILDTELGVAPTLETTQLYETIRAQELNPPPESSQGSHNLPRQTTPFVGRVAELAQLTRLLADPNHPMINILGPGGIGKTRLAIQVADDHIAQYEDGVVFVSLAPLKDPEHLVPAIAAASDFFFYQSDLDHKAQLLNYFRHKSLLLVLDNFEHLTAGAGLISEIIHTASGVQVLVTSRHKLNLSAETILHLDGLICSDDPNSAEISQSDALQLFIQSARRVGADLDLQTLTMKYINRICCLLDGNPLGIVLSAAWMDTLHPQEIAAEIQQDLDFLAADLQDTPERQTSMRAAFNHSWNLLSVRNQQTLAQLSVFRGGCTRHAAQQITDATLRELSRLVNKSLLHLDLQTNRYEIHELVRQFAVEKLEESSDAYTAIRDQHSAYFCEALGNWNADLRGSRQLEALAEMDLEIENIRTAWDWAMSRKQIDGLYQAVDGICELLIWRGLFHEGERICRCAESTFANHKLPITDKSSLITTLIFRAKCLSSLGFFLVFLGQIDSAIQQVEQGLVFLKRPELSGQDIRFERAFLLERLGNAYLYVRNKNVLRVCEESLELYEDVGDLYGQAYITTGIGHAAIQKNDIEKARKYFLKGWRLFQKMGNTLGEAHSLCSLGAVAFYTYDYENAWKYCERSSQIYRSANCRNKVLDPLGYLNQITFVLGRYDEAEQISREIISIHSDSNDRFGIAREICDLSWELSMQGMYDEAFEYISESNIILNDLNMEKNADFLIPMNNPVQAYAYLHSGQYEEAYLLAKKGLKQVKKAGGHPSRITNAHLIMAFAEIFGNDYTEAQRLLQEGILVAKDIRQRDHAGRLLAMLSYPERGLGNQQRAREALKEALGIAIEFKVFLPLILVTPGMALLYADQGELEKAVEIYALALRYPMISNSHFWEKVVGNEIDAVAADLPADIVRAAQTRGRKRDIWQTARELLDELEGKKIDVHMSRCNMSHRV